MKIRVSVPCYIKIRLRTHQNINRLALELIGQLEGGAR